MSVEGIPMEDLHEELNRVAPGSADERQILATARQRRQDKTDEFRAVRNNRLEQTAEHGVIDPAAAQQIGKEAIEHVTGEHRIPVEVIDNPGKMH